MLNVFNKKFSSKVFLLFTVSFLFIIGSLTSFFIRYQTRTQTETLLEKGKLIAGILADNSVIGVFSENHTLLSAPVSVICKLQGVVSVEVFNLKGIRLMRKEGIGPAASLQAASEVFPEAPIVAESIDKGNITLFRSPVIMNEGFSTDDALLFSDAAASEKARIIGWVSITLDKTILQTQFKHLLFKGGAIGFFFWVSGSIAAFFLSRSVTRPLNRLTESVKTLGTKGNVELISVLTHDEIGNLAQAFNEMSISLQKRQDALKESEKRLRFLSGRLIDAQEKERKRLSIELHDELGQSLAMLKHHLRHIHRRFPEADKGSRDECLLIIDEINQIIENVRRLSRDLSPSILEDLGLSAAIRWLIDCFTAQHAVFVSLKLDRIDPFFPEEQKTNIYRVVQEIFNNIGKHANAGKVMCSATLTMDSVHLIVSDDGRGFDVRSALMLHPAERGIGLAAMDERAKMLSASFEIISSPGKGTHIEMKIPISKPGEESGKQI